MFSSNRHRISLLFNANKVYDRQVIEGIGHYLQSSKVSWDVYLEEDCLTRLSDTKNWEVDGIIADYDDPDIQLALQQLQQPIVGVGGSYQDPKKYPNVPYVATDNTAVIQAAFDHLKQKGLENFAFYGLPTEPSSTFPNNSSHHKFMWAKERETAIKQICTQNGFNCDIYQGHPTRAETWHKNMYELAKWIDTLPSPIGIIAVTDARARHLVQVCEHLGRVVPDQISIIGIDDDDIARNLSRVSLSSVNQGCFEMGFQAAKLLHKQIDAKHANKPAPHLKRILVPPSGVIQRQSTEFQALQDPYVIQAMHYIRQHACKGIKVEQVTDFVGISRTNLEQRFVTECGHSVHTQLHNEKLLSASKLLTDTSNTMLAIAKKCGYPSVQYMYTVFKKHFGLTPNQYRLQNNSKH